MLLLWGAAAHWAFWAYHFEFEGWHTFAEIQYACYVWFAINIYSIYSFLVNHEISITKEMVEEGEETRGEDRGKTKKE